MTWKDFEDKDVRDDLKYAQRMMDAGFEMEFSSTDRMFKRTTPDNIPHDPIGFKNGKYRIWRCRTGKAWDPGQPPVVGIGWQVAELEDGYYVKHRGRNYHRNVDNPYPDRFPESNGFIPDLGILLELFKKGEL